MNNQFIGRVLPIEELEVPDVLYKYRCFNDNNYKKALLKSEIYIPSANQFNDPFDSKIPFRYKEEELTQENIYKKCLEIAKKTNSGLSEKRYQEIAYQIEHEGVLFDAHHLKQFDENVFARLCKEYGILCLTPDAENLLMWSYYGDSHKGFCIGYNSKLLVSCGLFGMGGQIAYAEDFPKLPLFLTENDNPLLNILFTKWNKWKHENEYRLIHTYKKGKLHVLPEGAISEIVFGCQLSDKDKFQYTEEILKLLPDIKIYQIEMDKKTFGLKKVAVFDNRLFIKNIH